MMRRNPVLLTLATLAAALALGGCQAIFTYSPVAALQRSPSSLTAAERVTYAENALASGNTDTMKAAYEAIKIDTGDQAQYLAAQLGFEASGVPALILQAVTEYTSSGSSSLLSSGSAGITEFLSAHPSVDPQYFIDATTNMGNVSSTSGVDAMDYVYAALGTMLGGAQQSDGTYAFPVTSTATVDKAQQFVNDALATATAGSTAYNLLSQFGSYITGL